MSRYVQRLGRVFEALQILDLYPAGIALSDLATLLGCSESEIRADLAALNAGSDLGPAHDSGFVLFLGAVPAEAGLHDDDQADAEDADDLFVSPAEAVAVRLHGASLQRGAGGLTMSELGAILQAAQDLTRIDPSDQAMAHVVAQIRSRWLPGVTDVWRPGHSGRFEALLAQAIAESRRVWLRYERLWQPGVVERTVDPYRLVRTKLGFELDAGPPKGDGSIRTYIVDHIRDARMTDESFDRPTDVEHVCADHRRTTEVVIVVPRGREWSPEYLSEEVTLEASDDESQLRVQVLEPVAQRIGLVVIQAGADAFVGSPGALVDAPRQLAEQLWQHHDL